MIVYEVQRYRVQLVADGVQTFTRRKVPTDSDAAEALRPFFVGLPHEEMWILTLNARLEVQGAIKVSQGGIFSAAVRVVDILRPVVASGHGVFVMAHNHPSGDPAPSETDIETTEAILKACKLLGLQMADHIVFGGGEYRSIRMTCGIAADLW
jgi:DNA repair protein RadC